MKFYTFNTNNLSFERLKLRPKHILVFFIGQIFLSITILFFISCFYNTPKEKLLKQDITYMLDEYEKINIRIVQSEAILSHIIEKDSIIYKSIFDIEDYTQKEFNSYLSIDTINNYSDIVKQTNKHISILNNKLDTELYNINKIIKEAYSHQEMLSHIPAIQPIENKDLKRTASGWGYRIHPIYKIKKFHYGLDFTARTGTPIYATGDATVLHVIKETNKASKGYGNLIILDHGYGFKTLYAHLSKFNVKKGDVINRGEIIGFVGTTGLSTGPHLHYEVIKNNKKVNPIHYLFNSLTPEEYQKIIEISTSIQKSYD